MYVGDLNHVYISPVDDSSKGLCVQTILFGLAGSILILFFVLASPVTPN